MWVFAHICRGIPSIIWGISAWTKWWTEPHKWITDISFLSFLSFSASPLQWRSLTHILMTTWRRSPARTLGPPTDAHAIGSSSNDSFPVCLASCSCQGRFQIALFDCVILSGSPTRRPTGRQWRQTTAGGTSAVPAIMRVETNVSVSKLWKNLHTCVHLIYEPGNLNVKYRQRGRILASFSSHLEKFCRLFTIMS